MNLHENREVLELRHSCRRKGRGTQSGVFLFACGEIERSHRKHRNSFACGEIRISHRPDQGGNVF